MTTPQDALMKELAGDTGGELLDPLELDPALSADPLEVKPVAPPSPVARLNAEHATKAGGKGFAVTVRGEYFVPSKDQQGKKVKAPYTVTVNLPTLDGALSVLKNKILDRAIAAKHPGSVGVRTIEIVSAVPLSTATKESASLQYMNRESLERFVVDHRAPIKPEEYPDVVVLRETVIDFHLNPNGFEAREALKQADRKQVAELLAMNPDLETVPGL